MKRKTTSLSPHQHHCWLLEELSLQLWPWRPVAYWCELAHEETLASDTNMKPTWQFSPHRCFFCLFKLLHKIDGGEGCFISRGAALDLILPTKEGTQIYLQQWLQEGRDSLPCFLTTFLFCLLPWMRKLGFHWRLRPAVWDLLRRWSRLLCEAGPGTSHLRGQGKGKLAWPGMGDKTLFKMWMRSVIFIFNRLHCFLPLVGGLWYQFSERGPRT